MALGLEGFITTTKQLELAEGEKTYQEWQQWALKERRKLVTLPDLYQAGEKEPYHILEQMQEDLRKYIIITGTTVIAITERSLKHLGGEIMHCDRIYGGGDCNPIQNLKSVPIKQALREPERIYSTREFIPELGEFGYKNAMLIWFMYNLLHHEQWAPPKKIIPPLERLTGLPAKKIRIQSNAKQSGVVALRTLPNGDLLIDATYPFNKSGRTYIFTQEFNPYSGD